MLKYLMFIYLSLGLFLFSAISSFIFPSVLPTPKLTFSSTTSARSIPSSPPKTSNCQHCHRPFRRLVKAMQAIEEEGLLSEYEKTTAFNALLKLPKSLFEQTSDPDQMAADILFQDKLLTATQYKRICQYLKEHPTS